MIHLASTSSDISKWPAWDIMRTCIISRTVPHLVKFADAPRSEFALRTRIEMIPSEMKEAVVMVTSRIKSGPCAEMSLRSSVLTESKNPDANVERGALPKWIEEISFPGRSMDSVAPEFLANRTAVRTAARASSGSANRVTPKIADECGETSSALQEGTPSIV